MCCCRLVVAVIFYKKKCSKDWKTLIARDGLQANMRFLPFLITFSPNIHEAATKRLLIFC